MRCGLVQMLTTRMHPRLTPGTLQHVRICHFAAKDVVPGVVADGAIFSISLHRPHAFIYLGCACAAQKVILLVKVDGVLALHLGWDGSLTLSARRAATLETELAAALALAFPPRCRDMGNASLSLFRR